MRRVEWSAVALADIAAQVARTAQGDAGAARRSVAAIESATGLLGSMTAARRCTVAGTYESVFEDIAYKLVYALSDGDRTVTLLRVLPIDVRRAPA